MSLKQSDVQNVLLRCFQPSDFDAIAGCLSLVPLKLRQVLIREGEPITEVFFPENGLCSILAVSVDRETIETSVFGREGMSDMVSDPGTDQSSLRILVQGQGQAWRISSADLMNVADRSPHLLKLMLRYQQTMSTQMAYTALSHGSFNIIERLARWLLMCQDRLGDDVSMVHEFLSIMLAVRRAGVTEAIHVLEGQQAIKATRGKIRVLDRAKLIELAEGSYGVPEAEYERRIGAFGRVTA